MSVEVAEMAQLAPKNHGKRWTSDEAVTAENMYVAGQPVGTIASALGRTAYAIECKLKSLGHDVNAQPKVQADIDWAEGKKPPSNVATIYTPVLDCNSSIFANYENDNIVLKGESKVYEFKEYVNGQDVSTMSEDALISALEKIEKNYERVIEAVDTDSDYFRSFSEKVEKAREVLTKELNERFS